MIYRILLITTSLMISTLAVSQTSRDTLDNVNTPYEWNFGKYRFGGYGEVLFQRMDYDANRYTNPNGAPKRTRAEISLPRAVFAIDYKFKNDIVFGAEIEFEYGGTGSTMEIEHEKEGGEFETEIEQGGEVVLEQLHLTKRFSNAFNIRIGHIIVPVGITNSHHEPVQYLGTVRSEGELALLPSTWHETGISVLGYFSKFKYEVMLVNGLDPNGFSSEHWAGSGRQKIFEKSTMTSPALAGRVEYSPINNLRISASGYYNKTAKNSSKPQTMTGLDGTVTIASADAQYRSGNIIARANIIYGSISDSKAIFDVNRRYFRGAGYSITPFGEAALTYSGEAGYNVLSFFDCKSKLFPFVRYEYYNTGEKIENGAQELPRYKRDLFIAGINYFLTPSVVLKADYSHRRINSGKYNSENTVSLTLAYTGWFLSK
jgi:opacity protein-like surface antigen